MLEILLKIFASVMNVSRSEYQKLVLDKNINNNCLIYTYLTLLVICELRI